MKCMMGIAKIVSMMCIQIVKAIIMMKNYFKMQENLKIYKLHLFLQIIRNSNYDLIEDDGNHRIIYMNNFYTSLDEISDKVIELYNYFEKEMTKDL